MKFYFKEFKGIYYIGDDYESFYMYDRKNNAAIFLKNDDQHPNKKIVKLVNCLIFTSSFSQNYQFKNTSYPKFTYLIREENQYKVRYEDIAGAFVDFLRKSECETPIIAAFSFVNCVKDNFIFSPSVLRTLRYSYSSDEKYSFLPSFIIYYMMKLYDNRDLLKTYINNVCINLESLIQIIMFDCANEIKTIDQKFAIFFNPSNFPINDHQKSLFYIVHYLLSCKKISINFDIQDDISDLYPFFYSLIIPGKFNYLNSYIFPGIFSIQSPAKFQLNYLYRFPPYVYKDLSDAFDYHNDKIGWRQRKNRIALKDVFIDDDEKYKSNLQALTKQLEAIVKKVPKKEKKNQNIIRICEFLTSLKERLSNVKSKLSSFPYEKLSDYDNAVVKLDKLLAKCDDFWSKVDGCTDNDLLNDESILNFIEKRLSNP